MTALLATLAVCGCIAAWGVTVLRGAAHNAAIRRRLDELAEESAGDWPALHSDLKSSQHATRDAL